MARSVFVRFPLFLVVLAMVLAVGCGATAPAAPAATPAPAKAAAPADTSKASAPPAAAKAGSDAKITIKLASVLTANHLQGQAMERFAKTVAEKTNNRVEVKVHHNAALGASERDYAEGLQLGTVEMAKIHSTPLTNIAPRVTLLDLPYVFRDFSHLSKVVDGAIGAELSKDLEAKGIKPLIWFDSGTRSMLNKTRPVRTPADMKGIKIRVMESQLMKDTIGAMGGIGTPMAMGELYTSMQQGVVDGAENSPATLYDAKLHEVAKNYSMTRHFVTAGTVAISKKFFDGLPADIQKAIDESAIDMRDWERKEWKQYDEVDALAKMVKEGVKVNDDVDIPAFQKAVEPIIKQYEPKIGADLIKRAMEIK